MELLEAPYRDQKMLEWVVRFFREEALFIKVNKITESPANKSQVKTKLTLRADTGVFAEYAVCQINVTRIVDMVLKSKKIDDRAKVSHTSRLSLV